jgi:hypothetical protein
MNIQTRIAPDDVRSAMTDELENLLGSPELKSAPVMRRLLTFLVAQTIAGNSRSIKAYTIAVEGLGRSEDFDPLSDSYPRVQVGRLRKILEAHYAHRKGASGPCLYIPRGHYEVRLARQQTAYPQLSGQPSDPIAAPPYIAPPPIAMVHQPVQFSLTVSRPWRVFGVAAVVTMFATTVVGLTIFAIGSDNCAVVPGPSARST